MRITECDENQTAVDPNHDPITLEDGFSTETYLCLPPDLEEYSIEVGGAYWGQEISWRIVLDEVNATNETIWHEGGSPYDYSTCPTPSPTACTELKYTIEMHDSYGDGWEGNEIVLFDCDGNMLKNGITLDSGFEAVQEVCLSSPYFYVECGGGEFETEVSWDILDSTDQMVLEGTTGQESLCPTCEQAGGVNLTVYVKDAHLPDGGEWYDPEADAYTRVHSGDNTELTKVKNNNNDPHWKQFLYFGCVLLDDYIDVKVFDEDDVVGGSDDLLVWNRWTNWASWKEGHIKRLNDTTTSNSDAYHKEYYVEVAYFLGHDYTMEPTIHPVPYPTPQPSLLPSIQPTPQPSLPPSSSPPVPAPIPAPTKRPTPASTPVSPPTKSTKSPTHMPTKGPGGSHSGSSDDDSTGAVIGGVFGAIIGVAVLAIVAYYLNKNGYCVMPVFMRDKLVDLDMGMSAYSPMGAATGGGVKKQNNMTFNKLQEEVRQPQQQPTSTGGYVPPVLATPDDDDEEEVVLGGIGRNSASV